MQRLSRSGKAIGIPHRMVLNLEILNTFLDGEIWYYSFFQFIIYLCNNYRIGRGDPIDAVRLSIEECDVNWAIVRYSSERRNERY